MSTEFEEWLESISYIGDSQIPDDCGKIYYSKVDGSYLTRVGMEEDLNYLFKRGITEQIQDGYGEPRTACIGYNPVEQKWYGWSHRAIYGFGVGSEVKAGSCAYLSNNKESFLEREFNFWSDPEYSIGDDKAYFCDKYFVEEDRYVSGVEITYTYNDLVPNKSLRGTVYKRFCPFPDKWGRGEWTALTLEDAKQMAIDFARGVA